MLCYKKSKLTFLMGKHKGVSAKVNTYKKEVAEVGLNIV